MGPGRSNPDTQDVIWNHNDQLECTREELKQLLEGGASPMSFDVIEGRMKRKSTNRILLTKEFKHEVLFRFILGNILR